MNDMRIAYTEYGCIYHFDFFDIKAFYSGKESDCDKFKHNFSLEYFSTFNEALNDALKYLKK